MIIFDISSVLIFLEPPLELKPEYRNRIVFYGIGKDDIPENFFQDAGDELKLNWLLSDYVKEKQSEIQLIERIDDGLYREAITRAARTKNMWDCCYSIFDTEVAVQARVSLLVEYELSPTARMDDNDCQFLFQQCRKLYFARLAEIKARQANLPETKARGQAWSLATQGMLETYGIPHDRMEVIAREGSQVWVPAQESDTISAPHTTLRSYPHTPWFYFILPELKKVKYNLEIHRR